MAHHVSRITQIVLIQFVFGGTLQSYLYSTNHVYLHRFSRLRLRLKHKTLPAFRVFNTFYFQTDFNLRFKRKRDVRLTCKRVWCILHRTLSLKWLCPLHCTLSLTWIWPAVSETLVLNETKPTNAHRSQINIFQKRQTQNVQFRFMPNAFRILKPIQKSLKCVCVFRNTVANAVAKNQTRLAYEDKRDVHCISKADSTTCVTNLGWYGQSHTKSSR